MLLNSSMVANRNILKLMDPTGMSDKVNWIVDVLHNPVRPWPTYNSLCGLGRNQDYSTMFIFD